MLIHNAFWVFRSWLLYFTRQRAEALEDFDTHFIVNLLLSVPVKEWWKWGQYYIVMTETWWLVLLDHSMYQYCWHCEWYLARIPSLLQNKVPRFKLTNVTCWMGTRWTMLKDICFLMQCSISSQLCIITVSGWVMRLWLFLFMVTWCVANLMKDHLWIPRILSTGSPLLWMASLHIKTQMINTEIMSRSCQLSALSTASLPSLKAGCINCSVVAFYCHS